MIKYMISPYSEKIHAQQEWAKINWPIMIGGLTVLAVIWGLILLAVGGYILETLTLWGIIN